MDDSLSTGNIITKSKASLHPHHHDKVWPIGLIIIRELYMSMNWRYSMLVLWPIGPKPKSPLYPGHTQFKVTT